MLEGARGTGCWGRGGRQKKSDCMKCLSSLPLALSVSHTSTIYMYIVFNHMHVKIQTLLLLLI